MTVFYLSCIGLIGLALCCWYFATRMSRVKVLEEQRTLVKGQVNIFRHQLQNLAMEKKREELDEKEYNCSVDDLKRQLLHDLTTQHSAVIEFDGANNGGHGKGKGKGKSDSASAISTDKMGLLGLVFLTLFVVAFYGVNGQYQPLQKQLAALQQLETLGERAVAKTGEPLALAELQQFALGLRSKLHLQGDNGVAHERAMVWLMLGRVTQSLEDLDSAELAFEKAYSLDTTNVTIMLNYAQVLLMRGEDKSISHAATLLAEVLRQDPNNIDATLFIAYIAEQRGDLVQANNAWLMVAKNLPEGDPRAPYVRQKISEMMAQQGPDQPASGFHHGQQARENSAGAAAESAATDDTGVKTAVSLKVNLIVLPELVQQVPKGSILFVYAKAAKGRPMPAAVVKLDQFTLPMQVELSDANAMMASYKLSNLDEVVIYARISKDQNIEVSAGELQGQTGVVVLADSPEVTVVIDKLL